MRRIVLILALFLCSNVWADELGSITSTTEVPIVIGDPTTGHIAMWDADNNLADTGFGPIGGIDGTAIHDDTGSEISAITAKTTPVTGDLFIIEDSAATYAKKSLTYGNLESHLSITESQISDLSHTTDTNANTICTGTTTYLDGDGNCDDISGVYLTSESDPQVATVTSGNFCKGTGTAVSCTDSSTYLTAEVDGSTSNEIQNLFETVSTTSGTSPVADTSTDTLTLTAGTGITVTGDSTTDTVTIASTVVDTNTNIYNSDGTIVATSRVIGVDAPSTLTIDTDGNTAILVNPNTPAVIMQADDGIDSSGITLNTDKIRLSFDATADLQIGADPGTSGEVITSQGPGAPPIWGASPDTNASTICSGTSTYLDGEGNCDTLTIAADTNADTICTGTTTYLDGEGNCDDLSGVYLTAEVDGSTTNELQNIFQTITTTSGTSPVADSTTDTLTLTAGTGITVTGDSATDTVTLASTLESSFRYAGAAGGTADAITLGLTPALASYTDGLTIAFIVTTVNTTAVTVNVDGLGAKNLYSPSGTALEANYLRNGTPIIIQYSTALGYFKVLSYQSTTASFTPTYSATGSMTYTSVTTNQGWYWVMGPMVCLHVMATGTVGGTPNVALLFTLPVNTNKDYQQLAARVNDAGASRAAFAEVRSGPDQVYVYRYDDANYTAGTGIIIVSGCYRIP